MLEIVLQGRPITKKNSQRFTRTRGKSLLLQSEAYMSYEDDCLRQVTGDKKLKIDYPVNLKVLYFMPSRHRVDLVNLLSATCDILVKAGVLADDNSKIVVSHDGSRVLYDKRNPRAEIFIEEVGECY